MNVSLESPDAEDTAVHAQSLRRIRTAMRSLSWLVLRAKVKLTAVEDTPPGSIDKRCEVELITGDGPPVVVTSLARDFHSAMQSALARASRSLLHRWQQEHGHAVPRPGANRLAGA
ncbi:MAG: HPF/RaiA family ribosome-associated protein [Pseudomonadota bacterium]